VYNHREEIRKVAPIVFTLPGYLFRDEYILSAGMGLHENTLLQINTNQTSDFILDEKSNKTNKTTEYRLT
jgi:hypothetical protein